MSQGTRVRGRVVEARESGRVKGRASIELRLTELVLTDGKPVSIVTKTYSAVAQATKKRDAAIIGGGTGTGAVLVTKGKEIRYPAESRLQFTLASPIEI